MHNLLARSRVVGGPVRVFLRGEMDDGPSGGAGVSGGDDIPEHAGTSSTGATTVIGSRGDDVRPTRL